MTDTAQDDLLRLGSFTFRSRLLTGTGKYPDHETARAAMAASQCDVVTVAVRRVDLSVRGEGSVFQLLKEGATPSCPTQRAATRPKTPSARRASPARCWTPRW